MEYEIIFKISGGEKNSRYLIREVENNENYKSVLLPVDEKPYLWKTIDVEKKNDFKIEAAKEKWIEKYKRYFPNVEKLKEHLIDYKNKNEKLKDCECGEWNKKKYPHILPAAKLNLLNAGYKKQLELTFDEIDRRKEIHKGFANLNSSQAFALNFFVPIIEEHLFDELLHGIKIHQIEKDFNPKFEFIKFENEGTQLDFYLETLDKRQNFTFEVKYSESAFGEANNSTNEKETEHNKKYNDIYKQKLEFVLKEFDANKFKNKFFEEYQLWRNISFASDDTFVCFVFPEFRNDLKITVDEAKKLCKPEIANTIHCIVVDEFVCKMMKNDNTNLKNHYTEFYEKYLDVFK